MSRIISPSYHPPPPWKLFHDLHYLSMSSIIFPWIHFARYHFAPWKWFNDLHYLPMSRIILPRALDFVFIPIKSPLQRKLMTGGAHPVTVALLVYTVPVCNLITARFCSRAKCSRLRTIMIIFIRLK